MTVDHPDDVLYAAVIFTTACDNFWSEALQLNGIDYILKHTGCKKVVIALENVETLKSYSPRTEIIYPCFKSSSTNKQL